MSDPNSDLSDRDSDMSDPDIDQYIKNGGDLDKKGGLNNETVLHLASGGGQNKIVEMLLKAGAEVNSRSDSNNTPLHWASRRDVFGVFSLEDCDQIDFSC